MDDEAKIEAAAKKFLLGLFTGRSTIEVVQEHRTVDGHPRPAWIIRLKPPVDGA